MDAGLAGQASVPPPVSGAGRLLQPQLFGGPRVGEALDQPEPALRHARAHRAKEGLLEDGRGQHLVVDDLLDLVELRLPALAIRLPGLALEQLVDLGSEP